MIANGGATGMHSVTHGVTLWLTPSWPGLAPLACWDVIWENIYSFWNFLPSVIILIDGLIVVTERSCLRPILAACICSIDRRLLRIFMHLASDQSWREAEKEREREREGEGEREKGGGGEEREELVCQQPVRVVYSQLVV